MRQRNAAPPPFFLDLLWHIGYTGPAMTKTVVAKLKLNSRDKASLDSLLKVFKEACNWISSVAFERRVFNPVALHHLVYRETREKFGLQANLAIRARDRVAKAYKPKDRRAKLVKFNNGSLDLDARLFRLIEKEGEFTASVSVVGGRIKIPLVLGEQQAHLLSGKKPTFATLVKKGGDFYLHIAVEVEDPPQKEVANPVGVDLGINNLATCSNGLKFEGQSVLRRRKHFRELRAALQAKASRGAKGAKRLLKRLSGRESRWMRTLNHLISRRIVDSLSEGDFLVLEDLRGIRQSTKHRKSQNADFHSWAFKQLQNFLFYKARERGIPVVFVKPEHTSQRCPRCGYTSKGNRRSQALFRCKECGFQHNADHVASLNIAWRAGSPGDGPPSTGPEVALSAASCLL